MINSLNDIVSVAAYLRRIGAEPRSLRSAVVKESHGSYWKDIAIVNVDQDGKVKAPVGFEPTAAEQAAITAECLNAIWPTAKTLKRLFNLPQEIVEAKASDVFEFRDLDDNIVMLQLRVQRKGEKSYRPYTYWSDNRWRCMEPEGKLPLWGMEQLKEHSTVFIHEGAKAARFVREMVEGATPAMRALCDAHPWGDELKAAAHLGWIGGALSPYRTDWDVLHKAGVKRVYIVSDNDQPGLAAVPSISFHLKVPTFHVQFTDEWPGSFDLADTFPAKMFRQVEGVEYYTGPSFRSCLHPATWATDQVPSAKGKPTIVLRANFKEMWAYVESADMFVCTEMPEILRAEAIMNKMLAAFSHTNETGRLIVREYTGRSAKLCYRPEIDGKIINDGTSSAINLHTKTHIKSKPGSIAPFIEFMEYMFIDKAERNEMMRWCATLIARLDVHMKYGILLVSESQGIGKTTLGSNILAPLVGLQNASFPSEDQIVGSTFNGWQANKRLTVINEIYSGHSFKAYNKLKNMITDTTVDINEKYQRTYTTENWCHLFACSNSTRALRVEDDDRRWFYPEVTEDKWPREKFDSFHAWLKSGGLCIVKHWAENFGDYVQTSAPAPMTARKLELIRASRSDAQQEAVEIAEAVNALREPVALAMKDIKAWIEMTVKGKVFDSDLELRKSMREAGMVAYDERILINKRAQHVLLNRAAVDALREGGDLHLKKMVLRPKADDGDLAGLRRATAGRIREALKTLASLFEAAM